ncbi:ATP-dependent protease subunit HslV [Desulfallas thermosapovorans]|uniref:ATP-dependent protease subunit HslV n=1 Tax=Desulfallas thermosapovorans DSM 6562 TaxID=1121431 RepID=A0A5S5A094_9FIRM|nr:ATP-dependent protease subunit HslV [Desulfallas thermosapovorans]TYO97910.1 ATP-dependent HslUV protease subunit HslV [Desulfallas thermosapovorans DSM 6562]
MFHATTIVAVKQGNEVAMAGDGQVTLGENTILKHNARKLRRLHGGEVLAGFAGSVADAITLFEKFEGKLESYQGNMKRAAVELAKEWRTDKYLRRLEALLIVADKECILVISGNGEIIEPDDGVVAIGSGGSYAIAAARALVKHTGMNAAEIAREALSIASEICVYTNDHIIVETLKNGG